MAENQASETSPLLGKPPEYSSKFGSEETLADYGLEGSLTPDELPWATPPELPEQIITVPEPSPQNLEEERHFHGLPEVRKKFAYIAPAVTIGVFLAAADGTVVASSYGRIGSDLNALNDALWIATAYLLTITSFQPLYGKLSDIFGRKPALLFAYVVFSIGCAACGFARNIYELIAARAITGIGGGGLTTMVVVLISDIVPLVERGIWQGITNLAYGLGAGVGATLGGLLADTIGWRWAFLGQVPFCIIAIVTVALVLKLPPVEHSGWKSQVRRVDFLGAIVLISTIAALLLGLDKGSNVSWTAPITLTCLSLFLLLLALFILVEVKYAAEPFAPRHILFGKAIVPINICGFFAFCAWNPILFFLPLFWQAVDEQNATQTGFRLLPGIVASISGALIAGILLKKTGKYYILTVFAYATIAFGVLLVLIFTAEDIRSNWGVSIGLAACGFGNGIGLTCTLVGLVANVTFRDQAMAIACASLFRALGSTVGISVSATVVQQSLRTQLRASLGNNEDADAIVQGVRLSLDYIKQLEPDLEELVRRCYSNATRSSFGLMLGLGGVAVMSSFFVREKKLV